MIVIPAIDLKDGKCVRLLQGRKEDVTVYSDDPVAMAEHWAGLGAKLIHIVDLDGAFSGEQNNLTVIKKIRRTIHVPIQLGGGIRDMKTVEGLIEAGMDRIIIGTLAVKEPKLIKKLCHRFEDQIFVGIDARDGKVAVKGWVEVSEREAIEFAREMESYGVAGIIYTDISRDGMLTGPNTEAMARMVEAVDIPVIASGGVSGLNDIKKLMQIKDLWGVITGKALYSGTLNLKTAIELTKNN